MFKTFKKIAHIASATVMALGVFTMLVGCVCANQPVVMLGALLALAFVFPFIETETAFD